MRQRTYRFFVLILVVFFALSCANRGTPSGGPQDIEPPKIVRSLPENFSTNFNAKEIRIYFDEYIKLKDIRKQLIISPPMDPEPDISPMSGASKYIKITIKDTLEAKTTYAINFGQSVVDNNEDNPYPYYRYVFSTGDYIDSLSVKGSILDAKNRKPDQFVTVMLYEVDSTFNDSIVYNKKPKYVTNTLDSLTTFSIDNIKEGKYMLVALKDQNRNFTFQQKTDKIAFHDKIITVPTDTSYTLKLFKEVPDFKVFRPSQAAGQKIAFGFQGDHKDMVISILNDTLQDFETRLTKDKKTDTLYYWYKPKLGLDSARFVVRNKLYADTLTHKFREMAKDTLIIKALQSGNINYGEDFELEGSVPFSITDKSKIKIIDKDSVTVAFETKFDSLKNNYALRFERKESYTYNIQLLPEAFTDFFGNVNDTLNFRVSTKPYDQFGNIRVTLANATYPVIVQLTDDKGVVKYEQFSTEPKLFDFRHIVPGSYYLQVVFDANGNQKWDSGNYLQKRQPERISYYPTVIDGRSGWDQVVEFILEKTDPDPEGN